MCKELAGGKVSMEIKDVYPEPINDFKVSLKYGYVNSLVGKELQPDMIKSIVTSLGMSIDSECNDGLELSVPPFRVDVQRPCDVVEDILRIYGYNNVEIPTQLKSSLVIKGTEDNKHKIENIVGEQLVGCGFNEIMNNSLTKGAYYNGLNTYHAENIVKIFNPLSSDLNVMRATLLFGGLESIAYNANRKNPDLRFFEFGNVYRYNPDKKNPENPMQAYKERTHLGLWVTGKRVSGSWAHPDEDATFYELKAYVMNVLRRMGVPAGSVSVKESGNDIFSCGMTLETKNGKVLVELGVVSKKLVKAFGIDNDVYYADVHWDDVIKAVSKNTVSYREISKYPSVSRDLALLIDKSVKFADIERVANQTERKFLKKVELFDVYEGKNLPEGKKSYAVNFILQDEEKTLTDKQIDAIMNKLINNIKKELDAELR